MSRQLPHLREVQLPWGREAEDLYADYIEGHRSFRDITAEHRNINIK